MTPEIEALYPEIGQELLNALPSDFRQAWATAELLDDVSGTEVFYQTQQNEYFHIYDGLDDLDDLIFNLREQFKSLKQDVWSTITVWLNEEGRFSIDFGYEDVSDLGTAGARRKDWIKKNIGEHAKINYE
ncbi:hypothetical protein DNK06_19610 [Pseudomonas daroniae]|uniref:DUF600 domain-containing protein n=1 Tax=Phytopseudomonas daroniae TaxID=2487519 RepID=A0A4Q9QIK5_9GAMM|nr:MULTISPECIES: immunity protein YezG family protein [Pseudomonas]TBU74373.1 hypothetical protein DNK06_19610 [Pseudomonas daroniae]TBU76026.1 hypothetical protein DNK10_08575 [Pseudomonas daroniae]TBU85443.1 hypothetical protein DNK31_03645 [Pseudomonas sp. FRB 228]TBU94291.1 hypothetical protein DNJ99_03645 [Pseudomonas daroniae]